ncbi:MAG: serine/threonine-protein phosphatase, partial [Oscillospiraceae bacterium]|nr:serine/threonine-protein phosphatase [Oscillospiraceae bacterium]
MRFLSIAETDVGIAKATNQDSLLIKHAYYKESEILMAIICDGMGGLSHGELASATVIRRFSDWFEKNLAAELKNLDMTIVGHKWAAILKNLNIRIAEYGRKIGESL